MAIQNPPISEDNVLAFTLLELITLVNSLEQQNLKLLADIEAASDFADLKVRIQKWLKYLRTILYLRQYS